MPASSESTDSLVVSVPELVERLRRDPGADREVAVGGRIASLRFDAGGGLHFSLEAGGSRIDCVMEPPATRYLRFSPQIGCEAVACGRLTVEPDGGWRGIDVRRLEPKAPLSGRGGWRVAEERTRLWLEGSYRDDLVRVGNAPEEHRTYGPDGSLRRMSAYQFHALLRKLKVFRLLDRLRFDSLLDIGSGLENYPYLVGERYRLPAYSADLAHWVNMPFAPPPFGKLDRAVTLSVTRLPFADGAFDAVIATEVLEHLVRPVEAIAEMMRVARKYVVMTSLEALSVDRWQRWRSRMRVDPRLPHVERNFFVRDEIEAIFGPGLQHENLFFDPDLPASQFLPAGRQDAAYAALTGTPALVDALCRAAARRGHDPGAMGIVLLAAKPGAEVMPPAPDDAPLARWLIDRCARNEAEGVRLLERLRRGEELLPPADRPVAAELLARLRCPDCRGPLEPVDGGLGCLRCEASFPSVHGVPILHPRRSPPDRALEDEVRGRLCGADERRWRKVRRVMRSLRRAERGPGLLRRAYWRIDGWMGGR